MIIFRYKIPCIITNNKELITTSIKYILLVIISNLLYIPGTVFKYSLQAIGKEKWVFRISIIINFIEVGIILLFVWFFKWGLYGVYAGMMLGYITLTVILFLKMKY
nr:MATE family efflux transporter [Clostridium novyi]